MGQPRGGVTHEPVFVFLEKDSATEFSLSIYFLMVKNVSFQRGALCWTWGPLCVRGCPSFCIPSGCSQPGVSTLTWGWRGSRQRPLKATTPQGYLWWIYSQPGDIETYRNLPSLWRNLSQRGRAEQALHLTLPGGGWPWGLEDTSVLPGPLKLLNSVFKLSLKVSKKTPVFSSLFVGRRVSMCL